MRRYIFLFSGWEDAEDVEYITRVCGPDERFRSSVSVTSSSTSPSAPPAPPPSARPETPAQSPPETPTAACVKKKKKRRTCRIRSSCAVMCASYPGGGAVGNSHLLDDGQVSWSGGGHLVVSWSQKTPVVSVFGCKINSL